MKNLFSLLLLSSSASSPLPPTHYTNRLFPLLFSLSLSLSISFSVIPNFARENA